MTCPEFRLSHTLLPTVFGLALLAAPPVAAQADPSAVTPDQSSANRVSETLTITARRREETVQQVPAAVTAFSALSLRDMGANDLEDLGVSVPNVNIVLGRGSSSSANIFIRGLGQPDALQSFDPGVGVYLDDVYMSRIQGALFKIFDIERIEVLRGPQGTLYGKNTIGGAIKLVTRRPGNEFEAFGEVTAGRFGRVDGKAFFGGPIIEDKVAFSASFLTSNRDGIVKDPATGRKFNDDNTIVTRAAIVFTPTDNFDADLSFDYTRQRTELTLGRQESDLQQVDLLLGARTILPAPTTEYDFTGSTGFADDRGQELDHWGISLRMSWEASDALTITSITAYRELKPDFYIDIDATPFEIGDVFVGIDQSQFSQELRFHYVQDRWDVIFGVYYLDEENVSEQLAFADDFLTFAGAPLTFLRTIDDDLDTTSLAAFVDVTFDITDRLSISGGVRYSYDRKKYFRTTDAILSGALFDQFAFEDRESWDAVTPSFSIDFQATDDLLVYARVARGFKSGGFNGRANAPGEEEAYDPEFVWTYEVGLKAEFADRRVTANLAAFYNDYKDFQARVSAILDPDAPLPDFAFPVLNAANIETYGIELELNAQVTDEFLLFGSLGYLKANYKEFMDAFRDRSDDPVPFAPKWTIQMGAAYTMEISNWGTATVRLDGNYKARHYLSVDIRDVLSQDGFWLLNASLTLEPDDGNWYFITAFRNITDEVYKTDAQEFSSVGNIQTAYYGDPFTWSITLGVSF